MGREQVTNGGWQSLERQETSPRGGCCGLHFLAPEAHSMTPPDPRDGHRREEEQLGGGGQRCTAVGLVTVVLAVVVPVTDEGRVGADAR